ncbi:3'(2'),5'-bisphosphate nucleotidase [Caenispirillum salinarum AK4]|uniref:3'(2'),5'-bisphosphate nucleotidase CysQ n=1 Tax=Caenispirillum salinarum AK4 TaxID=1238182 RepID=K9GWX2_9PROT|nr:3'(2'),5'-bisphosphate nucleotidase CysQ [Caenispirillum salinarum]EKV30485.1 3'(2'),5'-bisphosphate nucleotidase [Caenispirillum salinarum AK4]
MPLPDPSLDLARLLEDLRPVVREAGAETLKVYNSDFEVFRKDDASPVTAADRAAEAVILEALARLTPDIPVVAEEQVDAGNIPDISGGAFWLVDPLDGTKEFVNRRDEFTVNVGLIVDGEPVLGLVYCPVLDRLFTGCGPGTATLEESGERQRISVRAPDPDGLIVLSSRSHANSEALKDYLGDKPVKQVINAGSSLKFCRVAEGAADIYPRFGPTCEWDTAAAHAVLNAAGGSVTLVDGAPFLYAKDRFLNPHFIARGARA